MKKDGRFDPGEPQYKAIYHLPPELGDNLPFEPLPFMGINDGGIKIAGAGGTAAATALACHATGLTTAVTWAEFGADIAEPENFR